MPLKLDEMNVEHNPSRNRFELNIGTYTAVLDYYLQGSTIVFTHTGVPPALEGQGIGSKLVNSGLMYARENNLRVVSMCSFVDVYIRRHPEFQDLTKPK